MSEASVRKPPVAAIAVTVAACLALAYGAISETATALLRDQDPEIAVAVNPVDAASRAALAQAQVDEALTRSEIDAAMANAKKALVAEPVSATALRLLAEGYQLDGDGQRADRMMTLAGERNLRDTKIQLWLFRDALDKKQYDEAFRRADTMMRRRPDLAATLFPVMVSVIDDPSARNALLSRLRTGPSWRGAFLQGQNQTSGTEAIAAWLLPNLASSPAPPTDREVGFVAARLAATGKWADVRQLWDRFGKGGAGGLYDGDFEQPAREPPFGWRLLDRDGALASVERLDGGGHALFAQFLVGHTSTLSEMLLVLPHGHYRLTGRVKVEENPGGAFRWTVTCADSPSQLATHEEATVGGWRNFAIEFDTPADGCEAQWLRLIGTGGEGYNPARGWFDDLKLNKVS